MKRFIGIVAVVLLVLLLASPVMAASLGISPTHTELEVPGDGSTVANFKVYYFSGDLKVSLEDIPLSVEPQTIHIERSSEPVDIELTIYGDDSLGTQVFDGYIRFLGMSGGTVAVAVKVGAKVTNYGSGTTMVEGQIPEEPTEESSPPAPAPPAPPPGPPPSSTTGLPPSTIIAAAASVLFLILIATIIIRTAKRPRYRRPRY